ncbi:MFS transporter [Streptomyces albipurpureus]|uniref:MFS transporter n=1 Tax=Streptomyces albipurpureus TaxID=2897419 RepID=A0ABT0ULV6_9ACTN|nr:MFS transporter [Streptomyces sp. CWNU-1]MCM2389004.1 MFS transporter [Streptomyces sp. CWNU-1]
MTSRTSSVGPQPTVTGEHPAQRRVLTVLVIAQVLSGAALAAGITIGALLAEEMLGSTGLAGVPSALFTAGAAVGAILVGRACQRWGRRPGLTLGYVLGTIGSLGVVLATALDSVPVLFVGLLVYGIGTAAVLLVRYAGADLASPERRARAVSTVLFALAAGAIAGPNLVGVTGDLADSWDIPRLAGPFLLSALAFCSAAIFVWTFLRPDPLLVSRMVAAEAEAAAEAQSRPNATEGTPQAAVAPPEDRRVLITGVTVMVLSQIVMIAIMTMTPIHMTDHGHSTQTAGMVIGLHLGAMYLSSPLSGILADRIGRPFTATLGTLTMFCAALVAALSPGHSTFGMSLALILLGIGWNMGFVSGTALVADALPPATRAATQGTIDVGLAVAAAGGGMASGLIFAGGGYELLALSGGILILVLAPLAALLTLPAPKAAADAEKAGVGSS